MIKRPMLSGKTTDLESIKYPVLASPKLDGFRCLKINGKALTRSFKPVANTYVREYIESRMPDNIDGELMIPNANFNEISSAFRKFDGEPDFILYVFDFIDKDKVFQERFENLKQVVEQYPNTRMVVVPHVLINNAEELLAFEIKCLEDGYEGVMVRDPKGPYKEGRCTDKQGWLLKIKRFEDSEAVVLGFEEQMTNTNELVKNELGLSSRATKKENMVPANTLGKFLVRDLKTGVEFELGTGLGLTQELRKDIWNSRESYLGQIVKYKFQPVGVKERPRCPVWLGFRAPEDM